MCKRIHSGISRPHDISCRPGVSPSRKSKKGGQLIWRNGGRMICDPPNPQGDYLQCRVQLATVFCATALFQAHPAATATADIILKHEPGRLTRQATPDRLRRGVISSFQNNAYHIGGCWHFTHGGTQGNFRFCKKTWRAAWRSSDAPPKPTALYRFFKTCYRLLKTGEDWQRRLAIVVGAMRPRSSAARSEGAERSRLERVVSQPLSKPIAVLDKSKNALNGVQTRAHHRNISGK